MRRRVVLIALILLGLATAIGAALHCTRPGRLLAQELLSQLRGKGRERAQRRFRDRLFHLGLANATLDLNLRIEKAARRLTLRHGGTVLATFPIALGAQPQGQHERDGDGRTPEGSWQVCYKKEESRYHLFIGLSYPGPDDGARALAAGVITASEAEAILDAALRGERPPWSTALGGPFGLHGFGTGDDWTVGTVALENPHIEELFWNLPMGTPVTVVP